MIQSKHPAAPLCITSFKEGFATIHLTTPVLDVLVGQFTGGRHLVAVGALRAARARALGKESAHLGHVALRPTDDMREACEPSWWVTYRVRWQTNKNGTDNTHVQGHGCKQSRRCCR